MIEGKHFEIGQLSHTRPSLFVGSSQQFEYALQLIVNITARKKWSTSIGQLGEDASRWPAINGRGIKLGTKQYVGWSIPESNHFGGETTNRNAECTSQPKIGQLEISVFVDQQILWLEISMKNIVTMTELQSTQQLVHETFDHVRIYIAIQTIKVFLYDKKVRSEQIQQFLLLNLDHNVQRLVSTFYRCAKHRSIWDKHQKLKTV